MRLQGRHAIVTGGGTGIGAAIAEALAAEGASLTLVGRRREKLDEAARRCFPAQAGAQAAAAPPSSTAPGPRPAPGSIFVAPADVTDRAQIDSAFAAARKRHGPISILVNNAGISEGVPFAKVTERLWRDMLAVNLDGMFRCCQAALADLLEAEAGRIVTIASMAGLQGFAYASPYIAAKHGAVGLTRALAAEYARTNLRVNAVCPGFVDTEMTVRSVANITAKTGRSEGEARAELAGLNRSGRLIAPAEIASLTLALILSDRNGEAVEIA
ncbi:MAG: SDR family NAD(P)-dependent oxidoreductase [Alphaproteobacteria bacterium]|nr:MAG: SDR family NAD(P)-dependent oxidoreductase [Alphaproteobacteria bacterium]